MGLESRPSDNTIHNNNVLLNFDSLIIRNISSNWRVRSFKNVHDFFNSIYCKKEFTISNAALKCYQYKIQQKFFHYDRKCSQRHIRPPSSVYQATQFRTMYVKCMYRIQLYTVLHNPFETRCLTCDLQRQ